MVAEMEVVRVQVLVLVMHLSRLYVSAPVVSVQLTVMEVPVTLVYVGVPGAAGRVRTGCMPPYPVPAELVAYALK